MRLIIAVISIFAFMTSAQAVSLSQVIRDCGDDSKTYCKNVGYGKPMQLCLSSHRAQLKPACRLIVGRLEKGEPVRLFGW
jgi:hypothetical protein